MAETKPDRAAAQEIVTFMTERYGGNPMYDTTWVDGVAEIISRHAAPSAPPSTPAAPPTDRRIGSKDRRVAMCPECCHKFTYHNAEGCDIYACRCNRVPPLPVATRAETAEGQLREQAVELEAVKGQLALNEAADESNYQAVSEGYERERKRADALEARLGQMEQALRRLLQWLDADVLEILKDTERMGITWDAHDRALLRAEIDAAEAALAPRAHPRQP